MHLTMSDTLTRALEEGPAFQANVLDPVSHLLAGIRSAHKVTEDKCMRSLMAQRILSVMEALGTQGDINLQTRDGFTQAFLMLIHAPSAHVPTTKLQQEIRNTLTRSPADPEFHPVNTDIELPHFLAVTLLVVSRAQVPNSPGMTQAFDEGSLLHDPQVSLRFLLRIHAILQLREQFAQFKQLPNMSDEDIKTVRAVLDIVEDTLPEIDHEKTRKERILHIEDLLAGNEGTTQIQTRKAPRP